MRGESWERLVALPSERELDAALAEVRVRAIGIAHHRARSRRAWWTLASLAVVVGGVVLGRVSAGVSALPVTGRWSGPNSAEWNGWNAAELGGVATTFSLADAELPSVTEEPVRRFFIHSWTEFEGVRFDEGHAWVEGPVGTGFLIGADDGERRFGGAVHVRTRGDTMLLSVSSRTRRLFARSRAGRPLFEEGEGRRGFALPPGRALEIRPFGPARSGQPTLVVRIEGPRVPPPGAGVRWRRGPVEMDQSRPFSYWMWGLADRGADWQVVLAGRRGAVYGHRGVGGVWVMPLFDPQPAAPIPVPSGAQR